MDDSNSISISQALNHIQSWLNAGEYEKVIQGCSEILELEPGNQRALALMKMAEERRHGIEEAPLPPSPVPEPHIIKPSVDPLADLQVESGPSRFQSESPSHSNHRAEVPGEKRQFFLAMLVPAILVVLIGGGLIWYVANEKRSDLLADNTQTDVTTPPVDTTYLKENDQRIDDMTKITTLLETYKAEHGSYPALSQIDSVLTQEAFKEVPVDPKQGEVDKAGKGYGYVYALYDSFGKANQAYVLSALFEDSKGFGYAWTAGAPSKNYPDYRTVDEKHATFIGDSKK